MKRSSFPVFPELQPLAVAAVSVQRNRVGLKPGWMEPDDSGQGEVIAAVVRHDLEHGIEWVRGGQTLPPEPELVPEEVGIVVSDEKGFEVVEPEEPEDNWQCTGCGAVTSGPRCGVCGAAGTQTDEGATQAVEVTDAVVSRLKAAAREDTADYPRPSPSELEKEGQRLAALEAAARREYEEEHPRYHGEVPFRRVGPKTHPGPAPIEQGKDPIFEDKTSVCGLVLPGGKAYCGLAKGHPGPCFTSPKPGQPFIEQPREHYRQTLREGLARVQREAEAVSLEEAVVKLLAGLYSAPEGDPFHGLERAAQVDMAIKLARTVRHRVRHFGTSPEAPVYRTRREEAPE